jgi:hypothetical protein
MVNAQEMIVTRLFGACPQAGIGVKLERLSGWHFKVDDYG